jgi:adenylate cyclase
VIWQRLTPLRIAVLLALVLSALRLSGFHYLELLDTRAFDLRLRMRGPLPPGPEVVIVAIDDASVATVGRWPWSRAVMAKLLDRLMAADPAVVGFDIVQSEATDTPPIAALQERLSGLDERARNSVLSALEDWSGEDATLADAVRRSGRSVLGYFFESPLVFGPNRPLPPGEPRPRIGTFGLVRRSKTGTGEYVVPQGLTLRGNLPSLTAAARDLGFFNFIPDDDGAYRRAPLAIRYGEDVGVPLSLAMLRVISPKLTPTIRFGPFGVDDLRVGPVPIPVRSDASLLINYRGPGSTFQHIPAVDVLNDRVPIEALRGKLLLVGVTAAALFDIRVTPFDPIMPGVEMHANILDSILHQDFIHEATGIGFVLAEVGVVVAIVLLLAGLLSVARGLLGAVAAAGLLAAYELGSQYLFVKSRLLLSAVYPALGVGLTYFAISLQHYVTVDRERRKRQRALELYLSPSLAHLVADRPEMLKLGGEKRDRTVLFSDIRGFTTISEGLDPETLVELLNAFLGEMTDIIFDHDGMLDKYIGDAIMAVWGAPLPQVDHALRACQAALGMRDRLRVLQQEWHTRGWPRLDIGVGLNSGAMVFGNMGSTQHLSLTVIGDNVNLGSRLEGLTKYYGVGIIASETTVAGANGGVAVRELDLVRVKGKAQPVRIFELLGSGDEQARWATQIERFNQGLQAYRTRDWATALDVFAAIAATDPGDGPANLYLKRCREMLDNPPPADWDSVTIMEAK